MDNGLYIVAIASLAAYYGWAISKVGRAPKAGPIATRYQPPDGMSPAQVRYAWKGCVDERSVACVLAQLAVQGRISIERAGGGYDIARTDGPAIAAHGIAPEEQVAMDWLFSNFLTNFKFNPQHDAQGLSMALRGALDRRLRGKYEATHYGYVTVGLMGSLVAAYWLARSGGIIHRVPPPLIYGQFMAALLASIVVTVMLIPAIVDYSRGIGSIGRIVFGLVVSALGVSGAIGIGVRLHDSVPAVFPIAVMALAALNVLPVPWLRRLTPEGVVARAQSEGFRDFLLRVEQDQLDRANPSPFHLQSKEAMLPFAIALEVRETWGDSLANACWPHMITD